MDIRTKLVFALVAAALGSMLALGGIMYTSADNALRESSLRQLNALADSKEEALEQIFAGWTDRVNLIASRTQLRESLREFNRTANPDAPGRIGRILTDAVSASDVVESMAVYAEDGSMVASVGTGPGAIQREAGPSAWPVSEGVFYQGVTAAGGGALRVGFIASLLVDGRRQGDIHVRLNARAILDLTENKTGLGETGEIFIVTLDDQGAARILRRTQFRGAELWAPVRSADASNPARLALAGRDTLVWEGALDDQGEEVWAAVRYLPEAGWGLVVKIDAEEGRAPVVTFRSQLTDLALSLGAFAIVLGTILGLRFAKPIHELALVADRIRGGALSARATVNSEDEVGLLTKTFNHMAEELEQQLSLLREFQRYFDVSRDMLCIAGADGFFKRVNPAFERTLGWETRELLSRSFLSFVHPDDISKTRDEIGKLAKGFPTISFENRYKCANGNYKFLAWTAQPEEETGLIYAIARDVTDERDRWDRAEKEIRDLRAQVRTEGSNPGGAP